MAQLLEHNRGRMVLPLCSYSEIRRAEVGGSVPGSYSEICGAQVDGGVLGSDFVPRILSGTAGAD